MYRCACPPKLRQACAGPPWGTHQQITINGRDWFLIPCTQISCLPVLHAFLPWSIWNFEKLFSFLDSATLSLVLSWTWTVPTHTPWVWCTQHHHHNPCLLPTSPPSVHLSRPFRPTPSPITTSSLTRCRCRCSCSIPQVLPRATETRSSSRSTPSSLRDCRTTSSLGKSTISFAGAPVSPLASSNTLEKEIRYLIYYNPPSHPFISLLC